MLRRYLIVDYDRVKLFASSKYLSKYLNRGIWGLLSILGILHSDLFVLEVDDAIVGVGVIRTKCNCRKKRKQVWLYGIEVLNEYRGKGYGKKLMLALLAECANRGVKRVLLLVSNDNIIAKDLYEKLGFKCIGSKNNFLIMRYEYAL